jgi:hypothetical protein
VSGSTRCIILIESGGFFASEEVLAATGIRMIKRTRQVILEGRVQTVIFSSAFLATSFHCPLIAQR